MPQVVAPTTATVLEDIAADTNWQRELIGQLEHMEVTYCSGTSWLSS